MTTDFNSELAELAKAIAAEDISGGAPTNEAEKEKLHAALEDKISELLPKGTASPATDTATQVPAPTATTTIKKAQVGSKSYLDTVDDATVEKVNGYIAKVFQNGIQTTLREVTEQDPFILDVFHDALTDKLYGELKSRGLVK